MCINMGNWHIITGDFRKDAVENVVTDGKEGDCHILWQRVPSACGWCSDARKMKVTYDSPSPHGGKMESEVQYQFYRSRYNVT